jgi:hypothetical protein
MMKKLSVWALELAEHFFLKAHGWKFELSEDRIGWCPPGDYPFRRKTAYFSRGHAINAQKQAIYNPMHGGHRSEFN